MSCRIDRLVIGEDLVMLRISGRITGEDVNMLRALLEQERNTVALDLKDVLLVDREAVKLLAHRESNGAELRNCSAYIREWVTRERADMNASEQGVEGRDEIEDV
jgi:hypothetical protein